MNTTRRRLAGLGASLLILLLVVGTPLALLATGTTPWTKDFTELRDLLTSPDDGTLALLVIGVVAWVAWAVMTISFVVEMLAALRGVRAPRLPGVGGAQNAAGQLVAVAAMLFAAVPTITPVFAPQPAHAAPVAAAPPLVALPEEIPIAPVAHLVAAPVVAENPASATVEYQVRRGDSLWKIAKEKLGDGTRFAEIVALNDDVLHGQPDFIVPGLMLRLPSDAVPAHQGSEETYVVEPGDTLWDIAADELGDPTRYPEIYEASRDTEQPGGDHLTNPDLIRPGWELTVPGHGQDSPPAGNPPVVAQDPPVVEPPIPALPPGGDETPPVVPTPAETNPSAAVDEGPAVTPNKSSAEEVDQAGGAWLVPGLVGAGALLAGSLLFTVRAYRSTQQRYRRPGHTIAAPPPNVRTLEKTIFTTGEPAAEAIKQVDRLLRHLAANVNPLPKLDAAELSKRSVTLHLAEPSDLPGPWQGAERTWTTDLDASVSDEHDPLWPYQLLTSVGMDDDGHLWMLDLERLGVVTLTGDLEHALALARHLTAELVLNPWSAVTHVDTIGLASELAPIDPFSHTHHSADDTHFLHRICEDFPEHPANGHPDREEPQVVMVTTDARCGDVHRLIDLIHARPNRPRHAVVSVGDPEPDEAIIELTADGRLRVPHLDLDLTAAGLTAEEASACASIVELAQAEPVIVPVPRTEAATGWRALADHAGALREDLTQPRPQGEAGAGSLLPEATQRYEAISATTANDVATLAPVIPEQTQRAVHDADPHLDRDLEDWHDPSSPVPNLVLLGPVTATVTATVAGAVRKISERRAYFAELLAYLALHPDGLTSRQVGEAFHVEPSRARTDIGFLRDWLGINPRTGKKYLPDATSSAARKARGTGGYQLNGVLVDLDLFRRLRLRAQARGSDGMSDLVAALELIVGKPFSNLRGDGWSWLFDDERIHETTMLAIVDTAHIVATDALSRGDLDRARDAAETACNVAPYDDVCRLDLAKAFEAKGHHEVAQRILKDHVFNRSDDLSAPIDLPDRSQEVVENNDWGRRKRLDER